MCEPLKRKITVTFFTERELNDSSIEALINELYAQAHAKTHHIRHPANDKIDIYPWPVNRKHEIVMGIDGLRCKRCTKLVAYCDEDDCKGNRPLPFDDCN